ncbi:hypothetical protein DM02DRAFT_707199 [Periconia macrospinosa]|uniref:Uncharacterized protein n=1 Tax=Periconia macrospinosa TaxID=97972 RepID=A0A2V1DS34_9PLEO|nr:hypothetical protein DM02DRAFT_707199 [Periconia macrospinosa]
MGSSDARRQRRQNGNANGRAMESSSGGQGFQGGVTSLEEIQAAASAQLDPADFQSFMSPEYYQRFFNPASSSSQPPDSNTGYPSSSNETQQNQLGVSFHGTSDANNVDVGGPSAQRQPNMYTPDEYLLHQLLIGQYPPSEYTNGSPVQYPSNTNTSGQLSASTLAPTQYPPTHQSPLVQDPRLKHAKGAPAQSPSNAKTSGQRSASGPPPFASWDLEANNDLGSLAQPPAVENNVNNSGRSSVHLSSRTNVTQQGIERLQIPNQENDIFLDESVNVQTVQGNNGGHDELNLPILTPDIGSADDTMNTESDKTLSAPNTPTSPRGIYNLSSLPFPLGTYAVCMARALLFEFASRYGVMQDEGMELLRRLESATGHAFQDKKAYVYTNYSNLQRNFFEKRGEPKSGFIVHWREAIYGPPKGSSITAVVRSIDGISMNESTIWSFLKLCVDSHRDVHLLFQFSSVCPEIDFPGRFPVRGLGEVLPISAKDFYNHVTGKLSNPIAADILQAWRLMGYRSEIPDRHQMPHVGQCIAVFTLLKLEESKAKPDEISVPTGSQKGGVCSFLSF